MNKGISVKETKKTGGYGYKNLIVWQLSDGLAKSIYKSAEKFPKYEMYGLSSQLRRAVLSVPLNIVEGYARDNKKEFRNFLRYSLGSLAEVEYLLEFAFDQKYLNLESFEELLDLKQECGKVLWKFYLSKR